MKVPILTILSALVKICQISRVIFETASQFSFEFYITLQCQIDSLDDKSTMLASTSKIPSFPLHLNTHLKEEFNAYCIADESY